MSIYKSKSEFPIITIKNLPYDLKNNDIFDMVSNFGNLHQIRIGKLPDNKGSAIVIFKNFKSAKLAVGKLNGYNFNGRYLVVGFLNIEKSTVTTLQNEIILKNSDNADGAPEDES
ncbi:unnamed protein product [[Candida] boidinii]|uniref:Unnamed protein product n=1 Tax=Candida boidinii TaxID=5477 RepID=A0A9W6WHM3_CANBO|nr:nucleic acid binding protein [[Candida] boidinii]GME72853.1 unnamed protein product [[Candida] boidinii]GMF99976.1 unnamed protein product [[Candida] boidinii]